MYLLKIHPIISSSVTADSLDFTADNIFITVDSLDEVNILYNLKIIPREYKEEVKVILYNELTSETDIIVCTTVNNNNFMIIRLDYDFQDNDLFETTVTDLEDNLLWRGKIGATLQTDIQNYKMNVPNSNNIIKI
jgi:hypothetical protein